MHISRKSPIRFSTVVLVVAALLIGLLVGGIVFRFQPVHGEPEWITVSMSPSDNVGLTVNQTQAFKAVVALENMSSGPFTYAWRVQDLSVNASIAVLNGSDYVLITYSDVAQFTFLNATEDVWRVSVLVTASDGACATADAIVHDPYASPNLYLDDLPSTASYVVKTDGLGWYGLVNSTGQLAYSSTNASTVLIDAVGNATDSVFVTTGTYNLPTQISISRSDLLLNGEAGTILKNTAALTNATIFIAPSAHRITLSNFALDGTLSNSVTNIWSFGIQCQGSESLIDHIEAFGYGGAAIIGLEHGATNDTVQNCYVHDNVCFGSTVAQNGFNVVNASFDSFFNNRAIANEGDGLDIYGSANNILVEGNTFISNTGDGVHLEYWTGGVLGRVTDISIIGNILSSNGFGGNGLYGNTSSAVGGYAGVLVEAASHILISDNTCNYDGRGIMVANYRSGIGGTGSNFVTITNNHVHSSYFEGIHLNGTWYSTISNNIVVQNNRSGMLFDNVAFNTITGNKVYDNGLNASNTWSGIGIYNGSSRNDINDNIVLSTWGTNNMRYGIYADSTAVLNSFQSDRADGGITGNITILDSTFTSKVLNCWNGSSYVSDMNYNAGQQASCVNGTAIAHGLPAAPTSITVSLRGAVLWNATMLFNAPTIMSSNSTYFVICFYMTKLTDGSIWPVTAVEAQTVYWIAVYKP